MATSALGFQNWFSTTLSTGITASETTIYLNSLPTPSEGYLVIEPDSVSNREVVYFTSKGANFVTCPSAALGRGVDGSTAASHSSGVTVQMNVVAAHLEALQDGTALAESISRSNGWFAGTSTWVYASATTFTVSAGEAAFMSVGTKIWLTQTTSKYFYVTGVSGTTVTVTGGSDYTVANAAITAPYFSNAATPYGFPGEFNYTPTYTQLTVGNGTHNTAFRMVGSELTMRVAFTLGNSSSVGTNVTFSLPITASSSYKMNSYAGVAYMEDNGVAGYVGFFQLQSTTSAGLTYGNAGGTYLGNGGVSTNAPSMTGSAWATGDYFSGTMTYKVA